MGSDQRRHAVQGAFDAFYGQRDAGQARDGSGGHSLLVIKPEDGPVAFSCAGIGIGGEQAVDLIQQQVTLDPLGIVQDAEGKQCRRGCPLHNTAP